MISSSGDGARRDHVCCGCCATDDEHLRVLVVTNMYPTPDNPFSGTFVREQVEALRALGVEIDVLFADGPAAKINYLKGILDLRRRIRRRKYDLIQAHYVFSGWIARLQAGIPLLVSSHGSDSKGYEGWLLRRLLPLADAFTVTAEEHRSRPGMSRGRVIPCGANIDLFAPMPRDEARRALGWDLDKRYMLFVGRESPEKRLDIVRAAYDLVRSRRGDVELALAIGVKHDDIPLYMNAADVLVLVSDHEGAPVVIKEAMACNLPVVSVDVGDVREVIGTTAGCYICDRAPESVADKVELVLAEGKRTDGREVIAARYSTASEARSLLCLYREILAKRTNGRSLRAID